MDCARHPCLRTKGAAGSHSFTFLAHNPLMDPALIRRLPKTDLHVHLDGSLRLPSLIEMAR